MPASRMVVAASVMAIAAAGGAFTIIPGQHDFGKVAVDAQVWPRRFVVQVPPGAIGNLSARISGPHSTDFFVNGGTCFYGKLTASCYIDVFFQPKAIGKRSATLIAEDTSSQGKVLHQFTSALSGDGIEPLCIVKIVGCNYAHHYTGRFGWSGALQGPAGRTATEVNVDIIKGVATCNGMVTTWSKGAATIQGPVQGKGLVTVEFVKDDNDKLVYVINVACPGPAFPGAPPLMAEMGHFSEQSYEHPAKKPGIDLVGSISYPDGATDPLNGISGTVAVSWVLCLGRDSLSFTPAMPKPGTKPPPPCTLN